MPNQAHREAQELAVQAASLVVSGHIEESRALYEKAAWLEEQALEGITVNQPRTRAILAVSVASLYYKAGLYDQAERVACSSLADGALPGFARDQLRELLEVTWEDQTLQALGRQHSAESISISLRGASVGAGEAPISLVVDKIVGVSSIIYRTAEWLGRFPFRSRGMPPAEVQRLCQPWVSQPQSGSFRFTVRLVQPLQLELIPSREVTAAEISTSVFNLVRTIAETTPRARTAETVQELIPDRQYRHAMLRLLRNVAPDGHYVREVEFAKEINQTLEKASLLKDTRSRITESLKSDQPSGQQAGPTETESLEGTLRALHLDQNWIEVVVQRPERHALRCDIAHDILDDVIGPMVNRRVLVHGYWNRLRTRFHLSDIELTSSDEGEHA